MVIQRALMWGLFIVGTAAAAAGYLTNATLLVQLSVVLVSAAIGIALSILIGGVGQISASRSLERS